MFIHVDTLHSCCDLCVYFNLDISSWVWNISVEAIPVFYIQVDITRYPNITRYPLHLHFFITVHCWDLFCIMKEKIVHCGKRDPYPLGAHYPRDCLHLRNLLWPSVQHLRSSILNRLECTFVWQVPKQGLFGGSIIFMELTPQEYESGSHTSWF